MNSFEALQTELQSGLRSERLAGKVAQLSISPKSLKSMADSILRLPNIFTPLQDLPAFKGFIPDDIPTELANQILSALEDEPPISINEGGIFAKDTIVSWMIYES